MSHEPNHRGTYSLHATSTRLAPRTAQSTDRRRRTVTASAEADSQRLVRLGYVHDDAADVTESLEFSHQHRTTRSRQNDASIDVVDGDPFAPILGQTFDDDCAHPVNLPGVSGHERLDSLAPNVRADGSIGGAVSKSLVACRTLGAQFHGHFAFDEKEWPAVAGVTGCVKASQRRMFESCRGGASKVGLGSFDLACAINLRDLARLTILLTVDWVSPMGGLNTGRSRSC
jgi:hypothetical protein